MGEDKLVLLTKVFDPGAAHMIRTLMEANEIPSFVFDDNPAGAGLGIREIRVMVPDSDLSEAQKLLEETKI